MGDLDGGPFNLEDHDEGDEPSHPDPLRSLFGPENASLKDEGEGDHAETVPSMCQDFRFPNLSRMRVGRNKASLRRPIRGVLRASFTCPTSIKKPA